MLNTISNNMGNSNLDVNNKDQVFESINKLSTINNLSELPN